MWNYKSEQWYLNPIAAGASALPDGGWITCVVKAKGTRLQVLLPDKSTIRLNALNYSVYSNGHRCNWDTVRGFR